MSTTLGRRWMRSAPAEPAGEGAAIASGPSMEILDSFMATPGERLGRWRRWGGDEEGADEAERAEDDKAVDAPSSSSSSAAAAE